VAVNDGHTQGRHRGVSLAHVSAETTFKAAGHS
jgi:hypothetical protein